MCSDIFKRCNATAFMTLKISLSLRCAILAARMACLKKQGMQPMYVFVLFYSFHRE